MGQARHQDNYAKLMPDAYKLLMLVRPRRRIKGSEMRLSIGQAAPWFTAPTPSNPTFAFSSLGGRYVLLAFLPQDAQARATALSQIAACEKLFDQTNLVAFCVIRDGPSIAAAKDRLGVRWFLDRDGAVSRGFGALTADGADAPHWLVLDPALRVLASGDLPSSDRNLEGTLENLPTPDDHADTPLHAPVLIVPRVFEPEICRRLIDFYEATGGERSGVMREIDGKTVGVLDDFKSRRDAHIQDLDFRRELRHRLETRLVRQINNAFQFRPTRIERYLVARYAADEGGHFRAHRDNTTAGTAHRKFACSINLNAEGFEGGDLRFPEFGSKTYRPPTGGAVVFSCSLLHEATPVTAGRRYAFLPFFYDEAGEEIRQRNLHKLDLPETAPKTQ